MRSNYHNPSQSEDSVTKISRSKSKNQIVISTRIREKVAGIIIRKADGTTGFILNTYRNTIFKISRPPTVTPSISRPQKQTQNPQQEVHHHSPRNDRNDLSKAKRVIEPSLEKSNPSIRQTKSEINPTCAETRNDRRKPSTRLSPISKNCGTRKPFPSAIWKS